MRWLRRGRRGKGAEALQMGRWGFRRGGCGGVGLASGGKSGVKPPHSKKRKIPHPAREVAKGGEWVANETSAITPRSRARYRLLLLPSRSLPPQLGPPPWQEPAPWSVKVAGVPAGATGACSADSKFHL